MTNNKLSDLQHVLSFNHGMIVHQREGRITPQIYTVVTVFRLQAWHRLLNADPSFLRKVVKIPSAYSAADLTYCEYGCPAGVVAAYERRSKWRKVLI